MEISTNTNHLAHQCGKVCLKRGGISCAWSLPALDEPLRSEQSEYRVSVLQICDRLHRLK